jgi:hypothetical protein
MRKRLILLFGVLLIGYVPAKAQTSATQIQLAQTRPEPTIALLRAPPPPLPPNNVFLPIQVLKKPLAQFTVLFNAGYKPDRSLASLSPVQVIKTPFMTESSLPLAEFWRGRLQLDGFQSSQNMANILLGRGSHLGERVPRGVRLSGISLRLRLGRNR